MREAETIGEVLRKLREEHRLNQAELGAAIGVSRSTIAGFEGGHYKPSRQTLTVLADFFKVPLDSFRKGVPPREIVRGEFVNDPNEIALLHFWRALSEKGRNEFLLRAWIPHKGDASKS